MQTELLEIYKLLFEFFGPRNWWPGDSPFEVVIGAILTQNTSWKNVEKAISCIKGAGKLSPQGIFGIKEEELEELIKPSGFYRLKAKRIKSFMDFLFSHYYGDLNKMGMMDTLSLRTQLLGINGIGEETADSILLYALNRPVFVVDAYTKRIFFRLGYIADNWNYSQVQQFFMKNLPWDIQLFNDYHAQIVKLGNTLCRRTDPHCKDCPLKVRCPWSVVLRSLITMDYGQRTTV